jgi:hypothetical protein
VDKVDVGKALRTLQEDMAASGPTPPSGVAGQSAERAGQPSDTTGQQRDLPAAPRPAARTAAPRRRTRQPAPLPDEFPAGMHPDDWEPDWEDEPESARATARLARYFSPPPTP